MPIEIQVDNEIIEFPDGTSDEVIENVLNQEFQRTIPRALEKEIRGSGADVLGDLESFADIAFPLAGGVAGGVLGGPLGSIAGATGGKVVQEGIEKMMGVKKQLFPESVKSFVTDDTVIGNIAKEGILAGIGSGVIKAISKGAKALKPKEFIKMKNAINADLPTKGPGTFSKVGDYLQGVIDEVPESAKDRIIRNMSLSSKKQGVNPAITERVLNRGPKNVLTYKNLAKDTVDVEVAENASKGFEKALDDLGKEFDSKINPILEKSKDQIDVTDIIRSYNDDLSKIATVEGGKKTRLVGTAQLDDPAVKTLEKFSDDIRRLSANPTPKQLHKFKQNINQVLKVKSMKENQSASRVLQNAHKNVRNLLEDQVPGYKKITNEYREIFELQEEIGRNLDPLRVEVMAKSYFSPEKAVFKDRINRLMSKSDDAKEAINELLDQKAAKEFISPIKNDERFLGFKGIGVKVPFTGTSREELGKQLIRREATKFKTPVQRGARGAVTQIPRALIGTGEQKLEEEQ